METLTGLNKVKLYYGGVSFGQLERNKGTQIGANNDILNNYYAHPIDCRPE